MKAAVLYELGAPLVVEDGIEIPRLRDGQILVEMAYSGVCRSQLMEVRGKRGQDLYLPHMLGHEGSGIVIDIGVGVRKVRKGDRVVLTWIKGQGLDCGGTRYSKNNRTINAGAVTTFSERTVVSENRCVPLPDGVPMDAGCLFGCAVLTGAGIVMNTIRPRPDNSMVVWGAGGIGLSAIMGAKICEVSTIVAVDIDPVNRGLAQQFGATHVVDATEADPVMEVRRIVGDQGADFAVEACGRADTIEQAFSAVRRNGGLCVFASHPPMGEYISIDPFELICGKQIKGSWGGESRPDEDIPRLAAFYKSGKLPLGRLIAGRYSLDNINEALAALERGGGRILVEM